MSKSTLKPGSGGGGGGGDRQSRRQRFASVSGEGTQGLCAPICSRRRGKLLNRARTSGPAPVSDGPLPPFGEIFYDVFVVVVCFSPNSFVPLCRVVFYTRVRFFHVERSPNERSRPFRISHILGSCIRVYFLSCLHYYKRTASSP